MAPSLGESAHVAQAVGSPTGAVLDCVLQHLAAADEHHQRRLLEGGEVGIDDLLLGFERGHRGVGGLAHVPLAPPADRAEIDVVDVGMTVVSGPQPLDEIQMCGEYDRIVQYRHLQLGTVAVPGHDDLSADVPQPLRMVRRRGYVEQHMTRNANCCPDSRVSFRTPSRKS